MIRRFDEQIGPESTSCITIFIASPSIDVCLLGASKSSRLGPVKAAKGGGIDDGGIVAPGMAPRDCKAAKSGLKGKIKNRETLVFKWF